jgi:serine/threonine protein kinase
VQIHIGHVFLNISVKIDGGATWRPNFQNFKETSLGCSGAAKRPLDVPRARILRLRRLRPQDEMWILMEYATAGTLHTEIKRYFRAGITISEHGARYYTLQVMKAVEYLHDRGITHNDIHEDNVFLSYTGNGQDKICKLADFGGADIESIQPGPIDYSFDIISCRCLVGFTLHPLRDFRGLSLDAEKFLGSLCPGSVRQQRRMKWFRHSARPPTPPPVSSPPRSQVREMPVHDSDRSWAQEPMGQPYAATPQTPAPVSPKSRSSSSRISSLGPHQIVEHPPVQSEAETPATTSSRPSWTGRIRRSISSMGHAVRDRMGRLICFRRGHSHQNVEESGQHQ